MHLTGYKIYCGRKICCDMMCLRLNEGMRDVMWFGKDMQIRGAFLCSFSGYDTLYAADVTYPPL